MPRPMSVIPAQAGIQGLSAGLGPRSPIKSFGDRFRGDGGRVLWRRATLALLASAALAAAGCGFQLRGQAQLPFETLYIPGSSPLAVELKRNVAVASRTRLVDSVGDAQAVLGFTTLPTSEILVTRDMAYSDAQVLAKEAEEALLYRDMQSDMVQQILRRLVAAKPVPTQTE